MHILILGAGYAGLRVALELDKLLVGRENLAQVTLVDQHPYHELVVMLHLTATAAASTRDTIIPLERILKRGNVQVRQGRVAQIVPLQRQVLLDNGEPIAYDRLVIALGAHTSYDGVPGAREHTFSLRTYDEALRLRDHIRSCFADAAKTTDPTELRILSTFAIVGGGYTGCQLAGELADWVTKLSKDFGVPRSEVRIAMVERGHLLLNQFGKWATREAERVLDRRGVSIYLDTIVERVEPRALYVQDRRVLRAATIVWAGGVRAPELLAKSGLPTDQQGRVLVDRYLRVQDQALIFAAGDCAHIPAPFGGTVPATASYAMRQGQHLAETLLAEIEGRSPRTYAPVRLGDLVSLGPGEAVGDPLGMRTFGQPAALLKQAVERWYLVTLE